VETWGLQEQLGGHADRELAGCLLLKSFTTCWTRSRDNYPIPSSGKLIRGLRVLLTYVNLVGALQVEEALNLLSVSPLEASILMASVG